MSNVIQFPTSYADEWTDEDTEFDDGYFPAPLIQPQPLVVRVVMPEPPVPAPSTGLGWTVGIFMAVFTFIAVSSVL